MFIINRDDSLTQAGVRVFLTLLCYLLLFLLSDNNAKASLCITVFTYVMGKWLDTINSLIHTPPPHSFLEFLGVVFGILQMSIALFLIAANDIGNDFYNIAKVVLLLLAGIYVIIDFGNLGIVLKKFRTTKPLSYKDN